MLSRNWLKEQIEESLDARYYGVALLAMRMFSRIEPWKDAKPHFAGRYGSPVRPMISLIAILSKGIHRWREHI